ncbi:MAG TPA: MBL fold metallo-hydrolase [Vicinamibacterales bacterium]
MLTTTVARGVYQLRTLIANVFLVENDSGGWVLVDAGVRGYAGSIRRAALEAVGGHAPEAIVLTHGHFDHVGSLGTLLEHWPVPVYADALEIPYLTGRRAYPPPDPLVGGGAIAWSSRLLPRGPYTVGPLLRPLPPTDDVPHLPGWRIVHTPGHSDGHVSLFREADRVLLAGDAVTTVKQESLTAVAGQVPTIHGPPAYFTTDWDAARESVRALAALDPETLASGHGLPLHGEVMRRALHHLADEFDRLARPRFGRYVNTPARDVDGHQQLPPDPLPGLVGAIAAGAAVLLLIGSAVRRRATRRPRQRNPAARPPQSRLHAPDASPARRRAWRAIARPPGP